MPDIQRVSKAEWIGNLTNGKGEISTESGVLEGASYSVPSRFGNEKGTNPEELIAGALASCYCMMLSKILSDQKKIPKRLTTEAKITLRLTDGAAKISEVHLITEANVEGMDGESFNQAAEQAKEQCPVSNLIRRGLDNFSLDARLVSSEEKAYA